ncbi:DUF3612 domain-containing protein [Shewanella sp. SNU WT4]|uniref:DUF3612 domain-containing protein n=1 Tax=Shewanella sp. SNU WT4 TaxID=2590015 RepID=UPI00112DA789|nr:DUF3612 domain-containing protein [Shewanella sp. SNU WT4]QDF67303.1 DUF3612 domain-containing protein [Shewanella sp. SNU WT4]
MKTSTSLIRQSHFLGTKIRNLRKRNHLTIEDLSSRCIRVNPNAAPSVSYLSMIERGKRVPSNAMLEVIATVFQKDIHWFLDDMPQTSDITPNKGRKGGITGMALEPSFLFSQDILQIAIPEMLSQTGISGRQFAHLLIRAHQEHNQNHFPDIERAAESIGLKNLGLSVDELFSLCIAQGLYIRWIEHASQSLGNELGLRSQQIMTSYFDPPHTLCINPLLKQFPTRLKYDLAVHIGHRVLHNNESSPSVLYVGRNHLLEDDDSQTSLTPNAQDILQAWRDFESSFFAGALLCPKVPYRQLLDRHGYEINIHEKIGVSASVAMRRMTVASPYPHWHYFDAYAPGKLKAVYRGNGIPLPWGNMREVADPCQHWAVFRMINAEAKGSSAQISILNVDDKPRIYCCESLRVQDMVGNQHVLCAGIDLNPAIDAQSGDSQEMAAELQRLCVERGGESVIPATIKRKLTSVAKILNINWIERGINTPAKLICSRGNVCPRQPSCYHQGHNQCQDD